MTRLTRRGHANRGGAMVHITVPAVVCVAIEGLTSNWTRGADDLRGREDLELQGHRGGAVARVGVDRERCLDDGRVGVLDGAGGRVEGEAGKAGGPERTNRS